MSLLRNSTIFCIHYPILPRRTCTTQNKSHSFLQASTGYPESQEESNSLSQSQYSSTTEETPANAESATENHSLTSDQESLNITEENGS